MAVEAGDPEVSATKEKRGDGGAEGEERDLRVGGKRAWRWRRRIRRQVAAEEKRGYRGVEGEERDLRVKEELRVAGNDVVAELGGGGGGECGGGEERRQRSSGWRETTLWQNH